VGFEFDEQKSRANKAKHGVDFVEAQALWVDDALVEYLLVATPRRAFWSSG
jgi:uncharacterized DUF497 family protein